MKNYNQTRWRFSNNRGDFTLKDPEYVNCLYFPLANEAGMKSAITPMLHGDAKLNQHTFLLSPVSASDLYNSYPSRNFWFFIEGYGPWSVTGASVRQSSQKFSYQKIEESVLEAGLLWFRVRRKSLLLNLEATVTAFVPANDNTVELLKITVKNRGEKPYRLTPTAAVPIYGRSADNLRDHRHVTSLLQRIQTSTFGVSVCPTFQFNERGHILNQIAYGVFGAEGDGLPPLGFFPLLEEFIGEGGTLDWPEAVVKNLDSFCDSGVSYQGYEAIGALRFQSFTLEPGQERSYLLALGIHQEGRTPLEEMVSPYLKETVFRQELEAVRSHWNNIADRVTFRSQDQDFDCWMRWVAVQPVFRRIYGCSFLPHHDYGRGGRGWRDLWQDCQALLLLEPEKVRSLLYDNFAGVRIDGSNATIIGSRSGEFIADRNNIIRVWMDHGAWPFLTTNLYLNFSGDLEFLLEEQTYFKDGQSHRGRKKDPTWQPKDGTLLRQADGSIYRGTILEHLLVQNITQFFNVGAHNNIRLEGADWNDAFDLAGEKGESVALTALYCQNLRELAGLMDTLQDKAGIERIRITKELMLLIDLSEEPVNYDSPQEKQQRLERYFDSCCHSIDGEKVEIPLTLLKVDLLRKANWLTKQIREREWIGDGEGRFWFNGYYDNNGKRVEGPHRSGIRMTLTGQVFTVMSGIATKEQVRAVINAVDSYLKDPETGGYRLNTDFCEISTDLGRFTGFAYGHKENGAVFSHMVVMYAYALYKQGFVVEGHQVLTSLYRQATEFDKSRILPGIPEYFTSCGRGMYHYLTGSASWLLLTMLTEVYGVKGCEGDLFLKPQLLRENFTLEGKASVNCIFANKRLTVEYINHSLLEYKNYQIQNVRIDGVEIKGRPVDGGMIISRHWIEDLEGIAHRLEVILDRGVNEEDERK